VSPTGQEPGPPDDPVVHREKVIEDEIEKIVERRRNVGFVGKEDPRKTLVGLTLSGGGIRSASFNLGLLQAFYQHGLLRFVDYMSTVSGGGYIGAYLSSQVSKLASANKDFYKILDMPPSAVASNHAPPAQSANRPSGAPLNETPPATVQRSPTRRAKHRNRMSASCAKILPMWRRRRGPVRGPERTQMIVGGKTNLLLLPSRSS